MRTEGMPVWSKPVMLQQGRNVSCHNLVIMTWKDSYISCNSSHILWHFINLHFIPIHLIFSLHSTAPLAVKNMRRNGDSWVAGAKIYQAIAWNKRKGTDNEEPEAYVVRCKRTTPDTGTINIKTNTTETSLVLILPLPRQVVTYTVSVAGKAGTERGNYSNQLTVHYLRSMYYCLYLHALDSNTHVSETNLAWLQIAYSEFMHAFIHSTLPCICINMVHRIFIIMQICIQLYAM